MTEENESSKFCGAGLVSDSSSVSPSFVSDILPV